MATLGSFSGGGLGMGVAFVLEDYFSKTASDIERSMDRLDNHTERISNKISTSLKMMGVGAGMAGAGIGTLSIFKKGADVRAEFQAYEVQFETLLGSAEKAEKFFAKIKDDAQENPIFGTESLTAANAALMATAKLSEDFSRELTNNLAEVLAGVGKGDAELKQLAGTLNVIAGTGKATGMQLRSFVGQGVPIMELLKNSTGKTEEELQKTGVTVETLADAFRHATSEGQMFHGATERAAQSTKGLKAAMEDNIELTYERIGKAIEPLTRAMYKNIIGLTDKILEFVSTPVGQRIARWVAVGAGLLAVLGTTLVILGGLRIGAIAMARSFGTMSASQLAAAGTGKILISVLRQQAVAAWASLGPYALIAVAVGVLIYVFYRLADAITNGSERTAQIGVAFLALLGPIGWVIAGIAGISRGFKEMKKPLDEMADSGVIGFFTKVAAIIEFVRQVWSSFDGENAQITEDLRARLDKLGLLEFAGKVAAVVGRVKNFFFGLREGLEPVWARMEQFRAFIYDKFIQVFERIKKSAGDIWETMRKNFKPLTDMLEKVYDMLFGSEESLGTWKTVGIIVGGIVSGAFSLLVDIITVTIDIFIGLVEFIIWGVGKIIEAGIWLYAKWIDIWTWIIDTVVRFVTFMWNLPSTLLNIGVSLVLGLWEGVKSMWEAFSNWISDKVSALVSSILEPIKSAWNTVKGWVGLGDDDEDEPQPVGGGGPLGRDISYLAQQGVNQRNHYQTSKSPIIINQGGGAGTVGMQPIILQNWMDGDMVSEKIIEKQELKNARKG